MNPEIEEEEKIPSIVFIVPYRDRENHLGVFRRQMAYVLEDYDPDQYKIFFVHQNDNKPFNRGAVKNIGFLVMKEKYPDHYQDMTFVFNDIDTMPFQKNVLPYETSVGNIKHFYGFKYALGGIVSITGCDFEKIGGFPNLWAWGFEDNELQRRANIHKVNIDRSVFYPIMDKDIMQLHHGVTREISYDEKRRYNKKTLHGVKQINSLYYYIENDFIQVKNFSTEFDSSNAKYMEFNINKNPFRSKSMMMQL